MEIFDAFNEFHDKLKLDPDVTQAARDRHNEVRNVLQAAGLVIDAFLQGSFARRTAMSPLRDVDLVVVLAEKHRDRLWRTGGADTAMDLCEAALGGHFPDVTFERTTHSLKVDFGEDDFEFDVVPAFQDLNDSRLVWIADLEGDDEPWEKSNTKKLIKVAACRNQACDGRFIHVARMGKHFRRLHLNDIDGFTGMLVESILYRSMTDSVSYEQGCREFLAEAADALDSGEAIMDPTGVEDLGARLDDGDREKAATICRDGFTDAEEAGRLAADGDDREAIRIWHNIFGQEAFPAPQPRSLSEAAAALQGGSFTRSGGVSTSPRGHAPVPPGRSWRTL